MRPSSPLVVPGPASRAGTFLSVLVLALARATLVRAVPIGELELEWVAPSGCPTDEQVLEDTRSLVTAEPRSEPTQRIRVRAEVQQLREKLWRLTLSVGSSTRHVEAPSCTELGRTAALLLALMIDRSSERTTAEPALGSSPTFYHKPQPRRHRLVLRPAASARVRVLPPATSEHPLVAGIGVLVDHGTLPATTLLGLVSARHDFDCLGLTTQVVLGSTQTYRLPDHRGGSFLPLEVGVGLWQQNRAHERLRLGPEVGVTLGLIRARGLGLSAPRARWWPWVGWSGSLVLSTVVSRRFELETRAGVSLPVYRPRFRLPPDTLLYEPGPALRTALSTRYRF